MPRYRKWIKSFVFEEQERRTLTFVGVRLSERQRLELAPLPNGLYPTAPDLYASTRVTTPEACRKWSGFFVDSNAPKNLQGSTDVRFRLNDGVTERYWNSGANAWIAASPNNWNTEQEVADHIGEWPTQSLGVVLNLSTTNPRLTPYVTEVRLMFDTDLVALEDYIVRSLIDRLRVELRPISILAFDSKGQTTIDLGALQAPYDVVDVDAVYNNALDPVHMAPLEGCSYDAGTKTLTLPAQPFGHRVEVRFEWRPYVVLTQSQDYTEIAKIPAVVISDVQIVNTALARAGSYPFVINKGTGKGFALTEGVQADIAVPLSLIAPSSRDLHVMCEEVQRFFANNNVFHVRGQDEMYPIYCDADFADSSTATQKETFSATLQARILNAVFYPEDAKPITGVLRFKVTDGLIIDP